MLNKEKYASKIIEIAIEGSSIGMVNGKITPCDDIGCNECDWYVLDCEALLKEWANSEYIEPPKLTQKERQFCELVETGWIAKGTDGNLRWCKCKPELDNYCLGIGSVYMFVISNNGILNFSFIKYGNENSWTVEDLLKLEVEE